MRVILPGSYDPVTLGHLDLIKRAAEKHEEVYAVIFVNPDKVYTFSAEERLEMLRLATEDIPNVKADFFGGYVVDYMNEKKIDKIIKGYRSDADVEYEKIQADYNFAHGGYSTELYKCAEELSEVSSTLAREKIISGESLVGIVPESVAEYIKKKSVNL